MLQVNGSNSVNSPGPDREVKPPQSQHTPAKPSSRLWYLLFAIPYLALLWPPVYARTEPQLFGFPFFYWYQFAWVIISAILTGIVYLATERRRTQ